SKKAQPNVQPIAIAPSVISSIAPTKPTPVEFVYVMALSETVRSRNANSIVDLDRIAPSMPMQLKRSNAKRKVARTKPMPAANVCDTEAVTCARQTDAIATRAWVDFVRGILFMLPYQECNWERQKQNPTTSTWPFYKIW
ncbi:unnamed protein product, partial [Aphanomyces euteiches]